MNDNEDLWQKWEHARLASLVAQAEFALASAALLCAISDDAEASEGLPLAIAACESLATYQARELQLRSVSGALREITASDQQASFGVISVGVDDAGRAWVSADCAIYEEASDPDPLRDVADDLRRALQWLEWR